MEQLRRQNAQKINFNRIVGAVNALSESEKRKTEDNMKDIKNLFRLRKQIDNKHNYRYNKSFQTKKENETIKDKIIRDRGNK